MWKSLELNNFYNYKFDFDNQLNDSYDDWLRAFEIAVERRATTRCFMGLSSGYDSGVISKELTKQGTELKAYAFMKNEKREVINERLKYVYDGVELKMNQELWSYYYGKLKGCSDKILADIASPGLAFMFNKASKEGRSVFIAGQGADEIISDYSLFPRQSTFKGKFPDKLTEWENFREGLQREYLTGIEEIAEIFDVDVRYPFLDTDLVQEFLWLTPELKNRNYKAPLFEYLTRNNVPFDKEVKRGFRPFRPQALVCCLTIMFL